MKRILAWLMAAVCLMLLPVGVSAITTDCSACILVERDSGRVLYAENETEQLPMASTTKIMTALIAIEKGDLDAVVEIPDEAEGVEGSSIYLVAGEHMTLRDLLLGLLMHSGNDAAVAIAIHIAGSVEDFCALMNQKAQELGAQNTHFANPNGLPDDEHYTTAADYALIVAEAMKNPVFCELVATESAVIPNEFQEWDRQLTNKNKLLTTYDGANGVKTGYTKAAGKCFVGGAERDGMQLLTVVLHASDTYADSRTLLDYGFETYQLQTVSAAGTLVGCIDVENSVTKSLEVYTKNDIVYPLAEGEEDRLEIRTQLSDSLCAPVEAGTTVGKIEVLLDQQVIAQEQLVCEEAIPEATVVDFFTQILRDWSGRSLFKTA